MPSASASASVQATSRPTPTQNTDAASIALTGDLEKEKALLANGADVNAKDKDGNTQLYLAAEKGNKELAALLLKNKADVNAKSSAGLTPLHLAALFDKKEVAELLLKNKADVNAKADPGWTPLQFAATCGDKELVILLLDNKADVNAMDKQGWTPLRRALDRSHKDIADLLRARIYADMSKYVSADGITIPRNTQGAPGGSGVYFTTIGGNEMPISLTGNPASATLKYSGTKECTDDGRLGSGTEKFKPTQIETSKKSGTWIKVSSFTIGKDGLLVVTDESGGSYKIKLNSLNLSGTIEELGENAQ